MFTRPLHTRVAIALLGWLAAFSIGHAQAPAGESFVEGKNYFLIEPAQPSSVDGKIEVVEIFSYACPACNAFQPTIKKLRAALPANAVLTYLPASFRADEDWPVFQRAYYTAQALGIADKSHDALFDAVWKDDGALRITDSKTHQLLKPMPSIDDVAKYFTRYGVSAEDALATANSFAVNAKMKRADALLKAYGADSTPTLVVAGKYRLTVRSAGDLDKLVQLVNHLIAKESATQ
ncbi:MAG: thiol:disulfide interchange protein DsbA/DsbL [Xanthomonadales bacterium]|nr:thiol:disulfide interchange protein DsbA/DsbL [Xanthomonadales bacterium]MCC6595953.1 thiol:disulfide interchange protein DsbA/DsbL [Rhodanobacteraceae bacterium]MDL1869030.1 thiol:disulfide interchange protein DsbA/DsbL [Gammaproteobacteria bacterium PRO6]